MFRNKSASSHSFAMVPRAEIPRSSFRVQKALKTSFDSGYLIPIMVEEVLPGDTWKLKMTAFARLATPIFPVMDNLHFETFFFFVPNRLTWDNWQKFMGEQANPGDSTDYTVPIVTPPAGGYPSQSIADYMGIPIMVENLEVSALPIRAYQLIYNQWFRDQNIQNGYTVPSGDGPDNNAQFVASPIRRGKRHDYFTSCLPFAQKGTAVSLPLTGNATVKTSSTELITSGTNVPTYHRTSAANGTPTALRAMGTGATLGQLIGSTTAITSGDGGLYPSNLYADLSTVTATTINALRLSFQVQKLLERDARGGTRYTEIVRSHFGVVSPDARMQRPEYLGGGYQSINISPVAQTGGTGTAVDTPQGNLAAFGTMLAKGHGFTQSFTEHGYIIGLCNVRADLTYQQGVRRHWSRQTRYDYYFPAFAMLGEQAVLNREIYAQGTSADDDVFGYQERWAEYRYNPSEITGLMRSTATGTIDPWHLAQNFTTLPTLNSTFIQENPPLSRILAVGTEAGGQQLIMDAFFDMVIARPLPQYSVPGLIDHF